MKAYDLAFGNRPEDLRTSPGAETIDPMSNAVKAGWVRFTGPAVDPKFWPRGPVTGLPMMHVLTLSLPVEYWRRGPHLPAISFFQGEGQFAGSTGRAVPDAATADPFLRELAAAMPHRHLQLLKDVIGGAFAVVWLSPNEFAAGPTPPPPDSRRAGEHLATDEGTNAWDHQDNPTMAVYLVERPDPNAGIAPTEDDDDGNGYESPFDEEFYLKPWARALHGRSHLGGTLFCQQSIPDGLTPYYLELEEFGGLNFGADGNAHFDLESGVFDWACG